MKDQSRTKQALIQELASLRQRIAELEQSESVRKPVEYELWKSQEELQWLLKSMINAFVLFESIFDEDGNFISYRFVYINDAYERITGVKNEEVKGKTVHEVWPETEPEWIKRYGEVAVTGAFQKFELYHAPTKKLYYCNVYRPWDTKDHFCVIFEDITERERVEKIRSDLIEKNPMSIQIIDKEGFTLQVNPSHTLLFGAVPPPDFSIFADLQNKGFDEFILLAKKGEVVNFPDIYFNVHDIYSELPDKPVWIRAVLFPLENIDGNPERFVFMHEDITVRKRVEEKLRRSEENFRRSLDESPLGVRIMTAEGETIYANRTILDIYGYDSLEELKITPVKKRYTPESLAEHQMRREKRKRGDDAPIEYEINIVRKDGEVRHLQVFRKEILWDAERQFQVLYIDITDRKQAENALRESEEKYRSLFENSVMGISQALPDGRIITANTTYAQMYGYANTEEIMVEASHVGQRYANPEDREDVLRILKEKGVMEPREIVVVRRNGTRFTVLVGAREIRDYKGNLMYYQAEHIDITERKQAEGALRVSEERFRRLSEAAFEAIAIHEEGVLLNANDQFFKMFGYEPGEVIGKQVMPMTVAPEAREFMTKKIATGGLGPYESIGLRKDGTRFPMEIRARQMEYKERNVRVGAIRDITDRKRMEETLQETEKQYRQLSEDMPALICTFLPDSTLTYVNSTYCELFQKRSDELVGQQFLYFIQDEATRENVRRQYMSLTPENPVMTYEHDVIISDGTGQQHWHRWTDRAFFNDNGEIDHFQSIGQDITSRKWAEEELTISHKQLRALAGRIQQIREEERVLISREIHDELGGGLTGLKMDLSWLLRKMGNADPGEERVALMDKIHTSNALIDQMIKVVRRISADLRPSVLDDLGLIAALSWQSQEFTSRTEIPCEFVTSIDYINLEDETAIGVFRVFQEALTNVIRHSQATKVAVVLREDERSLFGDESLVLEIRDNGRGITEEEILNPESLGLLGMKERVLAFGGEFSIRGEPGGGTSLVLQIPRKQGEPS